ncbi:MAG: cupin, partial [Actinomycetota bacterium]
MSTLEHKSFEKPDEQRTPPKATIDLVTVAGQTLARGTFQPGWRWSVDVKPIAGTESCQFTHVGTVLQ